MDIISYAKACKAGGGGDKYQEKLVSGQNIKTVNGQDILGAGNLAVTTYQPFNTNWTTDSTIDAFCASVDADASAVEGMAYLGELTCSDLPFVGNADTVVEIMSGSGTSGKAIHVTITSGDIAPHRWDYTYWSNGQKTSGWVAAAQVEANPTMAGDEGALSGIEINGTKYTVGGHLYAHHLTLKQPGTNTTLIYAIIYNTNTTNFSVSSLYSYMIANGFNSVDHGYQVNGQYNSGSGYVAVESIYANNQQDMFGIWGTGVSTSSTTLRLEHENVIQIL